jgi:hypothetical protein
MSNYCQFCTNAFNSIQQCYQHTRLAHEVDVHQYWFPCPDCQKYFPNNGSLISHKKRYCLVCDHCNKLLPNRSQLRYHVEQIHSEVLMSKSWKKCSACEKEFQVGRSFNKHWNHWNNNKNNNNNNRAKCRPGGTLRVLAGKKSSVQLKFCWLIMIKIQATGQETTSKYWTKCKACDKTRLKILPVLTREHYTSLLHWV